MDILEQLFRGDIMPHSRRISASSEYNKAAEKVAAARQWAMEAEGEKRPAFDELEDCYSELIYHSELGAFAEGFVLGARLILAALDNRREFES